MRYREIINRTAYIDFDGTLVDVMPRYYGILAAYLETELNLDYEKYCLLKRQGLKDHQIVNVCCSGYSIDIKRYVIYKRENLENTEWLKQDTIIGTPFAAYQQLHNTGYKVCLLTQRRWEDRLYSQIENLQIRNAFDEIIVVTPFAHKNAKVEYLKDKVCKGDIIIGDSPVDMQCSEQLGIEGYFVETGLWGKQFGTSKKIFANYNAVAEYLCKYG